jgi:hypothetical protein
VAPCLRAIRAVAHQTNTAIIVSHHAGKASGTYRGSTAIRASFDDELQFTREDNETESEIRGALRAEGRNLQKVVEHIAFNGNDFRWVVTSAPPVETSQNMRNRILRVLDESDEWMDAKALTEAIAGAKLRTIQNELSRMIREKPRPFSVDSETPRKSAPRKYHGIHSRDGIHKGSVNVAVNCEPRPMNVKEFPHGASTNIGFAATGTDGIDLQENEVVFE